MSVGLEAMMLPAMIATARTKGRTFVLDEQVITPKSDIVLRETRAKKVFLPRLTLQVKVSEVTPENIEEKYQESEAKFLLICQNIAERFMQELPDGEGVYHQFTITTQPSGNSGFQFTREVAMVWAEKIISG